MSRTTYKRASFEELLEFANKVREAGGGNPLDALMPAVPCDPKACLIAKNLNFNCKVEGYGDDGRWVMWIDNDLDEDGYSLSPISTRIAEALDLELVDVNRQYRRSGVLLPPEIGQVAADFDKWADSVHLRAIESQRNGELSVIDQYWVDDAGLQNFNDFTPYIDESIKEAYANGVVNEKGELLL